MFGARFFQAAWVVNDLHAAAQRWIEGSGVGPFFIIPHIKAERVTYRGTPIELDFSAALAQSGDMQIELIQQHNDCPSAYRDTYPAGQEGFHHLCRFADEMDEDLRAFEKIGCPTVVQGLFGDMRFAYVDTRRQLGCMTEIIDERDSIKAIFATIREASLSWTGEAPIRHLEA